MAAAWVALLVLPLLTGDHMKDFLDTAFMGGVGIGLGAMVGLAFAAVILRLFHVI